MNTVAFSRLLARNLAVENPSRLGADAALDVLAAMNGGLQQFYSHAPARLKILPISRTVREVATVAVVVAAQYSRTLSSGTFTSTQVGGTVEFPGVPVDNEVAGTTSLFDEHLSATLASNVRVFSDALHLDAPIERLTSDIRLYGADGRRVLRRDDNLRERRAIHQEGIPEFYQFEDRSVSQAGSPPYLLRIWPLPTTAYIVRFEAECGPIRVTFANLVTPLEIPIPDAMVEDILLPLCAAHLTSSSLWADKSSISRTVNAAADVLGNKIPRLAQDTGVPDNTVGTPVGF